ncbi:MAG: serine hydrolase domain-containing protein [Bacteroidia bacterium]|nr:serine hydrolase domain-containing protein [Bacteroidia bacterium]
MRKFLLGSLVAMFVASASFAQQPNAEEIAKKLDEYTQEIVKTWQLPGMAVALSLDNKVILSKGYGVKELTPEDGIGFRGVKKNSDMCSGGVKAISNESGAPIMSNTVFQIGSVSKSFTATVMGQLIDEGLLKWTDTVKNILPDFEYYDPYVTANMQVMDVMTHRTGLQGQAGTYFPNIGYSRDDIYQMLKYVKPVYSFRGAYKYNNSTFIIAEKIIEKVTGKTWEQNVQERVFDKVKMPGSSVNADGFAASAANIATPHDYSYCTVEHSKVQFPELLNIPEGTKGGIVAYPLYGDEQALCWLTGIGPAGSVNSSVDDMIRYAQMHMNNGFIVEANGDTTKVMSEKAARELHKGYTLTSQADNRTTLYANCWFVEQNNRYRLYFHTGTTWGFTALCFFVPEIKACGVILVNAEAGDRPRYAVMNKFIDMVMGAPDKDYNKEYFDKWLANAEKGWADKLAKAAKAEPDTKNILKDKDIVGEYTKDELFGNAKITKEKDGLYIEIGKMGFKNKLQYIRDGVYNFRSDGHAFPVKFTLDESGKNVTGFIVNFQYKEEDGFGGWTKVK